MQGDNIDSIAKSVMQSPQGLKIITGLDKFNAAMSSDHGKQVLTLLSGPANDTLRSAAAAAAASPKDQGRVLLSNLLATKDGAALVGKIIEMLGL